DSAALKRAAYIIAASAEAIHDRSPVKAPDGKKNPTDWKNWSAQMKTQGLDLAKAIDGGNPNQVHKAANTLNDTCVKCHEVFKD
ncbi:MAG TPA: cytochrome c, partial [Gemmataceae bacterium]|nr:cytochrome c [Gemmataceae bacterium]